MKVDKGRKETQAPSSRFGGMEAAQSADLLHAMDNLFIYIYLGKIYLVA